MNNNGVEICVGGRWGDDAQVEGVMHNGSSLEIGGADEQVDRVKIQPVATHGQTQKEPS
jgi:hypothetical protein